MNILETITKELNEKTKPYKYIEVLNCIGMIVERVNVTNYINHPQIVLHVMGIFAGARPYEEVVNGHTRFRLDTENTEENKFVGDTIRVIGSYEELETEIAEKMFRELEKETGLKRPETKVTKIPTLYTN